MDGFLSKPLKLADGKIVECTVEEEAIVRGTKHNEAQRFSIRHDFNEGAYIDALLMIKATPSETTIVVGPAAYDEALTLAGKYGARCVLVPSGFMPIDQWLVIGPGASAWSEGT